MNKEDLAFAANARASIEDRPTLWSWIVIVCVISLLGGGFLWASLAELEEVTSGEGRVIPSRQLQVIQHQEGGIVREIAISEGQTVDVGSLLMRIDDTAASSQLGELRIKMTALQIRSERVRAEASLAETLTFSQSLIENAARAVARETNVFLARQQDLKQQISVLKSRTEQKRHELAELLARENKAKRQFDILSQEIEISRDLRKRGAIAQVELLRLERQYAEQEGEMKVVEAAIPRARSLITEAEQEIVRVKGAFEADAREKLADVENELAIISETIRTATDRMERTSVISPVRGIVNTLNVSTLGGVVQPGQTLMEIVPVDDALHIETKLRPQDVAFISPGQEASVKITAYDFSIYGDLTGTVELISADTITDEEGTTFFKAIIKTEKNYLLDRDEKLPIIPGMIASVDIQTGKKTVLDYLIKPLTKVRFEAMRER